MLKIIKTILLIFAMMYTPMYVSAENEFTICDNINVISTSYNDIQVYDKNNVLVKEDEYYQIGKLSDIGLVLSDNFYTNIKYLGNNQYVSYDDIGNAYIYNNDGVCVDQLQNVYFTKEFIEGMIVFYDYEKHNAGVLDENYDILIDNIYEDILIGENGNIFVLNNENWYKYDIPTATMSITDYTHIYLYDDKSHIVASNSDRYYIISNDIVSIESQNMIYGDMHFIIFENKGLYHVYSLDDDMVTYSFTDEYYFHGISSESILLEKDSKYYYKDIYGNDILELTNPYIVKAQPFYSGKAVVSIINHGENYVDKSGELLLKNGVDQCFSFSDGYSIIGEKNIVDEICKYYIVSDDLDKVSIIDGIPINVGNGDFWFIKAYDQLNNTISLYYIRQDDDNIVSRMYTLTLNDGVNDVPYQKYIISKTSSIEIVKCTFTRSGYTFSHWTDGTANYNPGDTFIMPDHDVTMTAVWKKNAPVEDDKPETDNDKPSFNWFPIINQIQNKKSETEKDNTTVSPEPDKYVCSYKDISGHWAEDIIQFIDELGLIDGITSTQFQPNEPMTREMFVTAVARLAGVESDYVSWAINNGILLGYGNGEYGLTDTVTREQMAVFFLRYFEKMGIDVDDFRITASYTFADDENISDWASGAVYEIQSLGLIKGKGNNIFDPQGTTTRAEAATVLYNLIQTVLAKIN